MIALIILLVYGRRKVLESSIHQLHLESGNGPVRFEYNEQAHDVDLSSDHSIRLFRHSQTFSSLEI